MRLRPFKVLILELKLRKNSRLFGSCADHKNLKRRPGYILEQSLLNDRQLSRSAKNMRKKLISIVFYSVKLSMLFIGSWLF